MTRFESSPESHSVTLVKTEENKWVGYILFCATCDKKVYITKTGKYRHYKDKEDAK